MGNTSLVPSLSGNCYFCFGDLQRIANSNTLVDDHSIGKHYVCGSASPAFYNRKYKREHQVFTSNPSTRMMSEYIYNPPPPPPTASSSTSTPYHGDYNNVHSDFQGGRGDGGGRGRRNGGGAGGTRGGRGGRERGSDTNYLSQRGNYQLPAQRGPQQRIPHPLPVLTQTPTDPVSLTQQPQKPLHPHLVLAPGQPYAPKHPGTPPTVSTYNLPGLSPLGTLSLPTQPPLVPLDSPYLSYSQEQYHAQNPSLQQLERHQRLPEPVPRDDFYSGNPSGWPAHSSYGHFESPQQPAVGRQRKYEKPDMDEAMWLRLNGYIPNSPQTEGSFY